VEVSEHPADLKPRTGKVPLGLIPYSVCLALAPEVVQASMLEADYFPDRDWATKDPRPFLRTLIGMLDAEPADVAAAFGHGAAKYAPWNWQAFQWDRAATTEYFGAICRHMAAVEAGEERAQDSGVCHRGHATAGAMIWLWHAERAGGVP
jgi:hypothetical protein